MRDGRGQALVPGHHEEGPEYPLGHGFFRLDIDLVEVLAEAVAQARLVRRREGHELVDEALAQVWGDEILHHD